MKIRMYAQPQQLQQTQHQPAPDVELPAEGAAESSPEPTMKDLMAKLDAYDAKFSDAFKRIGKLNERLRAPDEAPQPDGVKADAKTAGLSREQVQAMMADAEAKADLRHLMGRLTDSARKHVEEAAETQGPIAAKLIAESIVRFGGAAKASRPGGQAAGAPGVDSVSAPKTRTELLKLATSNPDEFRKVMDLAEAGQIKLPE